MELGGCSKPEVLDPGIFPNVVLLEENSSIIKNTTVGKGTNVRFRMKAVKGTDNITLIRITSNGINQSPVTIYEKSVDVPEFIHQIDFVMPDTTTQITFRFYAEDAQGRSASRSVIIQGVDLSQVLPTLNVTALLPRAGGILFPRDTIAYVINTTKHPFGEKIKTVRFTSTFNNNEPINEYEVTNLDSTIFVDTIPIILPNETGIWRETFYVETHDGKAQTLKGERVLVRNLSCKKFTNAQLDAQNRTDFGSFYITHTNKSLTYENAVTKSDSIDFVYYFSENESATLAAPDDINAKSPPPTGVFPNGLGAFNTLNATQFKSVPPFMLNVADFNKLNPITAFDRITKLWEDLAENPLVTRLNNLKNGNIVAFSTVDGRKGLLLIKRVTVGGDGFIVFDIIVQEAII